MRWFPGDIRAPSEILRNLQEFDWWQKQPTSNRPPWFWMQKQRKNTGKTGSKKDTEGTSTRIRGRFDQIKDQTKSKSESFPNPATVGVLAEMQPLSVGRSAPARRPAPVD